MKNSVLFLSFILYATFIFFINNYVGLLIIFLLNVVAMMTFKVKVMGAIESIVKLLPFILLTVVINCLLANYQYAFMVAIKLTLVCQITYIYAKTTTVKGIASTVKNLCIPLRFINVNPEDIELLVCIALSMLPIFKQEYNQLKDACLAKGMELNIKNMKLILTKLLVSVMKRVNEIEASMIEKGYEEI